MAENTAKQKRTSIGGQALIEGIMMRGPETTAMAVRHTSGEIRKESWPTAGAKKPKLFTLPLFRGIYNFIDSMVYGYKCLMRSAEMAGLEEEEETSPQAVKVTEETAGSAENVEQTAAEETIVIAEELAAESEPLEVATAVAEPEAIPAEAIADQGQPAEKPKKKESVFEKYVMTLMMVLSAVLGVALSIGLFLYLPAFLFDLLKGAVPAVDNPVLRGIFEGLFRIVLFVGYILLVSLMKDIRRVFMYHGAEHKTIFCYEAGLELTVENVRKQRRFHPRCGTSFMILMLLIGVIVSMIIPKGWSPLLRTASKLVTIPLVVGIGYELIKLAGRTTNWFTKAISAPGMWLQHITTKEPDDGMIECAIAALKEVIPSDPEADNW